MRCTVTRLMRLAAAPALLLVLTAPSARAQSTADTARAVSTVMDHRRTYMADTLPFDACSVQRVVGGGEQFVSRLTPQVRGTLDDPRSPCPRPARQGRSAAVVDSVRFSGETARVYLTVLRGELIHREDYTLNARRSSAAFMPVREIRLWGHSQAYPAGRRPGL